MANLSKNQHLRTYAFLCDIDGTLTGSDGKVTPENVEAFREINSKCGVTGVATGRARNEALEDIRETNPLIIIANNGADVFARTSQEGTDKYKHIYSRPIEESTLRQIFEAIDEYDGPGKENMVFHANTPECFLVKGKKGDSSKGTLDDDNFKKAWNRFYPNKDSSECSWVQGFKDFEDLKRQGLHRSISRMCVNFGKDGDEYVKQFEEYLEQKLQGKININRIGKGKIDFTNPEVDKAKAARFVVEKLREGNINIQQLYVFGDQGNDLPLLNLDLSDYDIKVTGCLVKNAPREVKAAVSYLSGSRIVPSNDKSGVAKGYKEIYREDNRSSHNPRNPKVSIINRLDQRARARRPDKKHTVKETGKEDR